ncbi:Transposase domain [Paenibacillus naphthalenovorans]|nr:Transposase domain [Paenibacillus naphthalenovorans]
MYILQVCLFSFEELLKIQPKERLPILFSSLDLRPYAKELRSRSPRGADGYCRQGILRALLAAPLEGIDTFTGLHHRLDTDLRFRYQCGLPLDREAPSISTLSRVFAELTKKGLAKQLFEDWSHAVNRKASWMAVTSPLTAPLSVLTRKSNPNAKARKRAIANWGAKFDSFGKIRIIKDCPLFN